MKTIGPAMAGNSSIWRRARAGIPNTGSAIVVTTVMMGRGMAKSEMNMVRSVRWQPLGHGASGGYRKLLGTLLAMTDAPKTDHRSDHRRQQIRESPQST